jgi:hypothetical protein
MKQEINPTVPIDTFTACQIVSSMAHYNSDYNTRMTQRLRAWDMETEYGSTRAFEAMLLDIGPDKLRTLLELI